MILSAQFANAENTAVVVQTDDRGAVAMAVTDLRYLAYGGATSAFLPDDLSANDTAAINATLLQDGSIVRALALVMFAEINKLRVLNGDAPYTLAVFKAALKAQMRT